METTRSVPRYPFVAPAEVIPQSGGAKIQCQVKELSLYGCYLDSTSTLPVRTRVTVKIFGTYEFFEATATVIYSNSTLGMGLVFRDVKPAYLELLKRWLVTAMQEAERERGKEESAPQRGSDAKGTPADDASDSPNDTKPQ